MEDEYRDFNNELVVRSYRQFCDEIELPFHFADEGDELPAELLYREQQVHHEAMNLFNRLKPELVLFKGDVVSFQFTDWGGGFSRTQTPVGEFLEDAADRLFYLQHLEKRFEILCVLCITAVGVLVYAAATWTLTRNLPESWARGLSIAAFAFPVGVGWWLYRLITRIPRRIIDDGRLKGVPERIEALRATLAAIRGDRPDPLVRRRQQRIGAAILSELRGSMSEDEIRRFVRRLQSRLFVVPKDEP